MPVSPIERGLTLTDVFGEPLPQDLVAASIEKLTELFPDNLTNFPDNLTNRLAVMMAVRNMFLNQGRINDYLKPQIEKLLKEEQKGCLDEAIIVLTTGYTADRNRRAGGESLWDLEINRLQSLVEAAQVARQKTP